MNILGRCVNVTRPIPHPLYGKEAIHLLRAILRECTYLPDAEARIAIKRQVLQTFRATECKVRRSSHHDTSTSDSFRAPTRRGDDEKLKIQKWLRKGYKGLRQLQRANEGEIRPLLKILHYTYGRGGRRRHELLRPILSPDVVVADSVTLEQQLRNAQTVHEPQNWDLTTVPVPAMFGPAVFKGNFVHYPISSRYGRLKALVRSQSRTRLPALNGRPNVTIRSEVCKVPTKNIWARSMPRKRAKNMVRKWYNLILSRVIPPLPEHEWTHLQGKINGKVTWHGPPPRRARPAVKPDTLTTFDLEKLVRFYDQSAGDEAVQQDHAGLAHVGDATSSVQRLSVLTRSRFSDEMSSRWVASPSSRNQVMEDLLIDAIGVARPLHKKFAKDRGHQITHRFMQRLWTQVFSVCPMLSKDEGGSDEWRVIWGGPKPKDGSDRSTATDQFLPLFPEAAGSVPDIQQQPPLA
jgi:hypothetical protein